MTWLPSALIEALMPHLSIAPILLPLLTACVLPSAKVVTPPLLLRKQPMYSLVLALAEPLLSLALLFCPSPLGIRPSEVPASPLLTD